MTSQDAISLHARLAAFRHHQSRRDASAIARAWPARCCRSGASSVEYHEYADEPHQRGRAARRLGREGAAVPHRAPRRRAAGRAHLEQGPVRRRDRRRQALRPRRVGHEGRRGGDPARGPQLRRQAERPPGHRGRADRRRGGRLRRLARTSRRRSCWARRARWWSASRPPTIRWSATRARSSSTPRFKGVGAHGSMPELGVNAIYKAGQGACEAGELRLRRRRRTR